MVTIQLSENEAQTLKAILEEQANNTPESEAAEVANEILEQLERV